MVDNKIVYQIMEYRAISCPFCDWMITLWDQYLHRTSFFMHSKYWYNGVTIKYWMVSFTPSQIEVLISSRTVHPTRSSIFIIWFGLNWVFIQWNIDLCCVIYCPSHPCRNTLVSTIQPICKLANRNGRWREGSFSIATTSRCRGGQHSFPWIAPVTLDLYLIMLNVKQRGIRYHFWVCGMTRSDTEPRSSRPLANTLTIMQMHWPIY